MTVWVPVLRRHWPFVTVFVLGTAVRVLAMIGYRPAIFYIDSIASYLAPLPTRDPTGQDPIGYDLYLLGPVLRVADFTTVVAVQHLLGLGLAVAMYALLLRKGAWRWLATAAAVPVLLDAYQVQIEHNLMSDPLFEVLVVGALVLVAWPRRPNVPTVAVAGLLLGLSATVREVGEVAVIPLVLYLIIAGGRADPDADADPGGGRWWRGPVLAVLALGCFAVPVARYEAYYHRFTGQYALSHAGGDSLYGRVATFADCDVLDVPAEERVLCPNTPVRDRPGPDFWAHDPTSPFFRLQAATGKRADGLARDFAMRVIRQQPLDLAASVGGDAVKVLSWPRADLSPSDPTVERWRFQREFPTFPGLVTLDSVGKLSHQYGDGDPVAVRPVAVLLRGYQIGIGYTPGPVLALCLLAALVGAVRGRGALRWQALLFATSGLALLLVGDVVLFSWRYQLPGYLLFPLAGALGVTALRNTSRSSTTNLSTNSTP